MLDDPTTQDLWGRRSSDRPASWALDDHVLSRLQVDADRGKLISTGAGSSRIAKMAAQLPGLRGTPSTSPPRSSRRGPVPNRSTMGQRAVVDSMRSHGAGVRDSWGHRGDLRRG